MIPARTPAAQLTRVAVVVYALLAAGSLATLQLRGHAFRLAPDPAAPLAQLRLAGPGVFDLAALDVALGLLAGLAIAAASQAAGDAPALRALSDKLRELLRGLTARQAVVLALASGVGEELLFRGVLYEELLPRIGSAGTLLATSALFGAAHFARDRRLLVWTVLSFAIGLLLGLLRLLTGALLAPIALHVAVNGLNLLVESWQVESGDPRAVDSRPA